MKRPVFLGGKERCKISKSTLKKNKRRCNDAFSSFIIFVSLCSILFYIVEKILNSAVFPTFRWGTNFTMQILRQRKKKHAKNPPSDWRLPGRLRCSTFLSTNQGPNYYNNYYHHHHHHHQQPCKYVGLAPYTIQTEHSP